MPSAKIELAVGSALGVALGLVWKGYADGELKTINSFYADLKKKTQKNE